MNNWTMVSSILWYRLSPPLAAIEGTYRFLDDEIVANVDPNGPSLPFGLECLGQRKCSQNMTSERQPAQTVVLDQEDLSRYPNPRSRIILANVDRLRGHS